MRVHGIIFENGEGEMLVFKNNRVRVNGALMCLLTFYTFLAFWSWGLKFNPLTPEFIEFPSGINKVFFIYIQLYSKIKNLWFCFQADAKLSGDG